MEKPFATYLRSLMSARGLTTTSLSLMVSQTGAACSRQRVRSWLRGSLPRDKMRGHLASALGVSVSELAARCAGYSGQVPS